MAANTLLDRLEGVKANGRDKWMAKCPAHDDRNPSLSIRDTGERVLIHCFSQCEPLDILSAVGLSFTDSFPDGALTHHVPARKQSRTNPWTLIKCASHALSVVSLADAKLCQFAPLSDDEREAVAQAVKVLNRFQT